MHCKLAEIRDFLLLTDHLATAGQPTMEQFTDIQAAGYEVVINLVPSVNPNFLCGEPKHIAALGMEYVRISVDWSAPTPDDLRSFFGAMRHHQTRRIFVHCAANKRASVFVFLYRVLCLQMDEADAEDDLEKIWIPAGVWRAFLNDMLAQEPQIIK